MISDLGESDPTKFIRHLWNSNRKFTREKLLYRTISKEINNPRKSEDFLNLLKDYALIYSALTNPLTTSYFDNPEIIDSLNNLKNLKASTFYPVILAMKQVSYFTDGDLLNVIRKIETMVFRNFAIGKKNPSPFEVFFAELALKIYNKSIKTVNGILFELQNKTDSDESFVSEFSSWSGSSSSKDLIRYIFRKIHAHIDPNNEISVINTDVHIEHIMPINYDNWDVSEDQHYNYLWKLGNLTLLSGAINKDLSNKSFEEKKPRYLESFIQPNKEIAKFNKWTEIEIQERQNQLAQYALLIWN
jgi:hypothetical protein